MAKRLLVYGPGLLSLACGALFTPLFEELLFRGWVWRGLERHGLRPDLRRGQV
ncbi:CPBP family intramembrane glutamic endopeptidase [Flavonifractor sp. An10]|uniref:CPBP family intramembrane glutamic endopeptidase n=1 Tax=Flavonifractor sp. An10 TaxID=1965537 RepID=UPI0013A633DB|nr:CPBP family intramembrane glutamic endopeptidase [Flavonifractor sp. An10]